MKQPFLRRLISARTQRSISYRLQYVALLAVNGILSVLGLDLASALMGRLWRWFAPFNPRHARADGHLAAAFPEMSAAERRRILGDMWENLGRTAAETILLPRLLADPSRVVCDVPAEELEKARGGAVFVSLHTGNWEIVSVPLRDAHLDLKAVYKPLRNALVDTWLADRRRTLYGDGLMPLDRGIAVRLKSLARSGATLAILADLRDTTAMTIDFFGRPALATPFPAMLARRLGRPLFAARSIRRDGAHFHVDGRWLDVPRTSDAEADVAATTAAIHAVFEVWIRENPSQWMWAHRKWL